MTDPPNGEPVSVSVVIPTLLRPSLAGAIRSVREQTYLGPIQIIVAADVEETDCTPLQLELASRADVLQFTGGNKYGGSTRNIGVGLATGDLVAFLDDDDSWGPSKIANQVATYVRNKTDEFDVVVSARFVEVLSGTETVSQPVPERLIATGERVEDYLFRSRRPVTGRPSIQTSSLLTSRETALSVPWSSTLRRHQDWDWLMRLQGSGRVIFVHDPEPSVFYSIGSTDSVSGSSDWSASLAWADGWRQTWSRRTYADFVTAQPMRYAMQARSWRGVLEVLRSVARGRTLPGLGPLAIGLAGAVPRGVFNRLVVRGFRRRGGG